MSNLSAEPGQLPIRLLLADPDPEQLRQRCSVFAGSGYRTDTVSDTRAIIDKLQQQVYDVCILSATIAPDTLADLLGEVREASPWTGLIVLLDRPTDKLSQAVLDAGVDDCLHLPCLPSQLQHAVRKHEQGRRTQGHLQCLIDELGPGLSAGQGLRSESPAMMRVLETAQQVAPTDATVLLVGESGTGKGVMARAIHHCSHRSDRHLVVVNCPSLSAELLESELFGHRRGAFTGAVDNTLGRVSRAEGGTLFLDEIGDAPLALQPKLLRFVQDKEFERIGDSVTRRANVRLIAATNQDLPAMVECKSFREDLFYRLNVITLRIPPLRERPEDIIPLAQSFVERYAQDYNRAAARLTACAEQALQAYSWPGNVRELQNLMERQIILGSGNPITARRLNLVTSGEESAPVREEGTEAASGEPGKMLTLKEMEQRHIRAALAAAPSLEGAAKLLDIHPSTLWRKRRLYGI